MSGREHLLFTCEGSTLLGTLDRAAGKTALLIVSGGNETRAGAWNGQAWLAARLATAGWPVLRFDRRGVGDSEGENHGFRTSAPDIAAALAALYAACPHVTRVVGLGNCDGAAALMLASGRGFDALVLSNPWTNEDEESETAPPAATRAHYARRLGDLAAFKRLLTGQVALRPLFTSVLSALRPAKADNGLTSALKEGLASFPGPVRLLVAERDRTGQTFLARWDRNDPRIRLCPQATHSYVEPEARQWLFDQVTAALTDLR